MVEQIERFLAELERNAFLDGRVLRYGEIDVLESGGGQDVTARVAESARRVEHKRGFVQPLQRRRVRQGQRLAWHDVRTIERLQAARIRRGHDGAERIAGLQV